MSKDYHHLTQDQRWQIFVLKKRGESNAAIAEELKVDASTISREIMRNKGKKGYRYKQAHEKSRKRRLEANQKNKKMTDKLIQLIESKLVLDWSPEQISGWLKTNTCHTISHEIIYQHIWSGKQGGGNLFKHLRRSGRKYNKRSTGKAGRGCIPNRIDIRNRPSIVEKKSRLGDWELDTIIGKNHKGIIVTIVERRSKLTKLVKVPNKTAYCVCNAVISKLTPLKKWVLTLTSDNGKEFSNHSLVALKLEAGFFFATPYHSWERGLNEHTNGLIRQYIPKEMSFEKITQKDLDVIESLLNNRPRKVLQYSTPNETFNSICLSKTEA